MGRGWGLWELVRIRQGSSQIMAFVALYPKNRIVLALSHLVISCVMLWFNSETLTHCQADTSTMFLTWTSQFSELGATKPLFLIKFQVCGSHSASKWTSVCQLNKKECASAFSPFLQYLSSNLVFLPQHQLGWFKSLIETENWDKSKFWYPVKQKLS